MTDDAPFPMACDLGVFDLSEREQHAQLLAQMLEAEIQREETVAGYRFRWMDHAIFPVLADWVALERRCCPFLNFLIELKPGQLTLELSGPDGVKEFLQMELGPPDLEA